MVRILRGRCRTFYVSDPRGERVPCGEEVRRGTYGYPKYSTERDCSEREDTNPSSNVSPATGWHLSCARLNQKAPHAHKKKGGNEGKATATYMMQISMSL